MGSFTLSLYPHTLVTSAASSSSPVSQPCLLCSPWATSWSSTHAVFPLVSTALPQHRSSLNTSNNRGKIIYNQLWIVRFWWVELGGRKYLTWVAIHAFYVCFNEFDLFIALPLPLDLHTAHLCWAVAMETRGRTRLLNTARWNGERSERDRNVRTGGWSRGHMRRRMGADNQSMETWKMRNYWANKNEAGGEMRVWEKVMILLPSS